MENALRESDVRFHYSAGNGRLNNFHFMCLVEAPTVAERNAALEALKQALSVLPPEFVFQVGYFCSELIWRAYWPAGPFEPPRANAKFRTVADCPLSAAIAISQEES